MPDPAGKANAPTHPESRPSDRHAAATVPARAGPTGVRGKRGGAALPMISLEEILRPVLARVVAAGERWRTGVAYNPLAHATVQDPYPVYAALRGRGTAHRSRLMNAWLIARHDEADAILRDHRNFANNPRLGTLTRRQQAMLPPDDEFPLLVLDPPDHKRLRALVTKAFTSRAIDALEVRIRAAAAALLDAVDDPGGFDLMAAFAQPLPIIVIAEMLGVPAEDRDRFKLWSVQRSRLLEPTVSFRERAIARNAAQEFDAYFRAMIAKRRSAPRDDILSALAHAEDEGERLTEREMLNLLRLLLIAGNETTANLIGNGLLALLANPDQLARLRDDPDLVPAAVEELMRFDSPVQMTFRRVRADCAVNGSEIRARDNVAVLIGAANRDPDVFEEPDRLDVGRAHNPHLSLGRGIHHCLGAQLTRLEGRIAFEALLERFAEIELLGGRPKFRNGILLRGLESLALRCRRA